MQFKLKDEVRKDITILMGLFSRIQTSCLMKFFIWKWQQKLFRKMNYLNKERVK